MIPNMLPLALILMLPFVSTAPTCGLIPPTNIASTPTSTQSGSASAASSSGSNSSSDDVLASAWFPGWLGSEYTTDNVTWSKYNSMTFAFATTTADVSTISLDSTSEAALPGFVSAAQENGVKALLSIGGWTGSQYYSTAVSTAANRALFVNAVVGLATKYKLDGIDFDWEYPGRQGVGCNVISPNDSSNFLSFLQLLRQDPIGANLVLSAAVGITPFAGTDGSPMTDVSAFAKSLDYIEIMDYDIFGSFSSTVGPNSPLNDSCSAIHDGSSVSAVNAWTSAKFPANQIALGVASYGHSFSVSSSVAFNTSETDVLAMNPTFDKSKQPSGDAWDGAAGVDQCGNPVGVGGIFNFWGLVDGGFLNDNGTVTTNVTYTYDECSQTPFVYNSKSEVMVSYDDATSFAAKGQFINDQGLKGFAMWNSAGDFKDILLTAISDAMGIEADCS